jgi:hypothetical protein
VTRFLPLDVRCPRCGAPPGTPCDRIDVREGEAVHTGRRRHAHLDRTTRAARETLRRRPRTGP